VRPSNSAIQRREPAAFVAGLLALSRPWMRTSGHNGDVAHISGRVPEPHQFWTDRLAVAGDDRRTRHAADEPRFEAELMSSTHDAAIEPITRE
jgi:hypothetical protein